MAGASGNDSHPDAGAFLLQLLRNPPGPTTPALPQPQPQPTVVQHQGSNSPFAPPELFFQQRNRPSHRPPPVYANHPPPTWCPPPGFPPPSSGSYQFAHVDFGPHDLALRRHEESTVDKRRGSFSSNLNRNSSHRTGLEEHRAVLARQHMAQAPRAHVAVERSNHRHEKAITVPPSVEPQRIVNHTRQLNTTMKPCRNQRLDKGMEEEFNVEVGGREVEIIRRTAYHNQFAETSRDKFDVRKQEVRDMGVEVQSNGGIQFGSNASDGPRLREEDALAEEIVERLMVGDESGSKHVVVSDVKTSRSKEIRFDYLRGQNISSQRVRFRKSSTRCRRDIETLTPQLLSIYESLMPAQDELAKQKQLLQSLENLVSKEWPMAKLHLYGSCANSFGFLNSDIDLCLAIDIDDMSKSETLLKLAALLEEDNLQNVQALTHARVPIVKLMDPATGISCDICINNLLAVVNTKLLRDYAKIDDRLRQLAFIVKHWAKSRGVNETYRGTLSSYAYVIMCIHFLQLRSPAILPCLQQMKPTYVATVEDTECAYFDQVDNLHGYGARNKESIAQLLWGFFHYWAYNHDYANDVISIRTGSIISKRVKDWTRRIGRDRHLICIEDPFETSHDLGRVVDKFSIRILREEFERAANILQYDPNPCVTLFEPYIPSSAQLPNPEEADLLV